MLGIATHGTHALRQLLCYTCYIYIPSREAKLSVLYWDEEAAELAPSSLHYFEGDPALRAGRTVFPMPPLALTDPEASQHG